MMPQTSSGADSAEGAETRAVRFAVERELSRVPHTITRIIVKVIKHLDAVGDDWSPMSDGDAETLRRHRTTNDDAVWWMTSAYTAACRAGAVHPIAPGTIALYVAAIGLRDES